MVNNKQECLDRNEQHEKLVGDMLKMYGYDVQLRPMPLGYAGTIYNCNLSMLQDLGLQRTVAKGVLKKLHTHAILCLHNIIKERRYTADMHCKLEETGGTTGRGRTTSTSFNPWAARYNTWLLIKLTPKGVVFSFFSFQPACAAA